MEGGWLGRRAHHGTVLILMCALVPAFLQPTADPCADGEYLTDSGVCCNTCPPGFKLSKACQATGQRSTCTRCGADEYMDKINYESNCKRCKHCKERNNELLVSPCKGDQNTICRCKDGFYKFIINRQTYQCLRCTECGHDEQQTHACTPEKNTECACKENFYRENNNKCVPCQSCTDKCKNHQTCAEPPLNTAAPKDHQGHFVNIIVGISVVALVLVTVVFLTTYFLTKRSVEHKVIKQQPISSDESPDSAEQILIVNEMTSGDLNVKAMPLSSLSSEQESSNLPDCVPLEIKTPDLVYLMLDIMPVHQVKQLVRSLGVSDTVIERAELDHHSSKEAHYQMLRAWAEQGSPAGRGGVVHRPQLQELIDTLRRIHLGRVAEELETKYCIQ